MDSRVKRHQEKPLSLRKRWLEPSGKGRGGGAREGSCTPLPTEHGSGAMRTEGRMPGCDDPVLSQGHVKSAGNSGMDENGDGLQRALEGELVEFLRNQNVEAHARARVS